MKIIGKGQQGKFLIEANKNEITNLFGEAYYSDSFRKEHGEIDIGCEIDVSVAFRKLSALLRYSNSLNDLRKSLSQAIADIEIGDSVFKRHITGED